jgi:hypothetical protein
MARYKDAKWNLLGDDTDSRVPTDVVRAALLMDIRDRLDRLLRVIECENTKDIPNILRRIAKNTAKKRRKANPPAVNP